MVRCPQCRKELKSTQALSGHLALAHRSASARGAESSAGAVSGERSEVSAQAPAATDEGLDPVAQGVQTLSAERSKSSAEPEGEPLEPASADDTYLAGFDQGGVAVKVACPTCGTFRTDDQVSMDVHQQGHKIDAQGKALTEQGKQLETLAQAVVGLKESVDSQDHLRVRPRA